MTKEELREDAKKVTPWKHGAEQGERCNCLSLPCDNCAGHGVLPIPLGCLFDKVEVQKQMTESEHHYPIRYNMWLSDGHVYNMSPTSYPLLTNIHGQVKVSVDE